MFSLQTLLNNITQLWWFKNNLTWYWYLWVSLTKAWSVLIFSLSCEVILTEDANGEFFSQNKCQICSYKQPTWPLQSSTLVSTQCSVILFTFFIKLDQSWPVNCATFLTSGSAVLGVDIFILTWGPSLKAQPLPWGPAMALLLYSWSRLLSSYKDEVTHAYRDIFFPV